MKKFLVSLLVILALGIGVVFAAVKMLPLDAVKPQLQEKFREATGRELKIEGDLTVSFWPNLAVRIGDVSVSNTIWGRAPHFLKLEELDAELKLRPLLQRRVEIDRFILRSPHIYLEQNRAGEGNWVFETADKPSVDNGAAAAAAPAEKDELQLSFGELKITGGTVHFENHADNSKHVLDNIALTIEATELSAPVSVKGKAQYRARQMLVSFDADRLSAVLAGELFHGGLTLSAQPFMSVDLKGRFFPADGLYLDAETRVQLRDLNGLLHWLSPTYTGHIPFNSFMFETRRLTAGKDGSGFATKIEDGTLYLDDLSAQATAALKTADGRAPKIELRAALQDRLDIPDMMRRFAGDTGTATAETQPQAAQTAAAAGWSQDIIDFSALRAFDADITLDHQGLVYEKLATGPGRTTVTLSGGHLVFNVPETAADTGRITARAELRENGANTALSFALKTDDMPMRPVLETFAATDKLTGRGSAYFNGTARGNTQAALVATLGGTAGFDLRDGMLHGVNFVQIAQLLQRRLMDIGLGDGGTEFADFNATFTVENGIMTNQDMYLRGPLVEAKGSGQIHLPQRSMNFRVYPQMILQQRTVQDLETGEETEKTTGLTVPVNISGPWANLRVRPDYQGLIRDVLSDPQQLEDAARELGRELGKEVDTIRGGLQRYLDGGADDLRKLQESDEGKDLLRGLFGR
ncbi:MAG: AsmA family protein [Micavibrio sp.]|nr:MAG: AsmA family protein [Micavibrio sp.]